MSGALLLRAALIEALRGDGALAALVNIVTDEEAPKVTPPALTLGPLVASDWGARGVEGLNVRVPITLVDRGDRPDRIAAAAQRAAAVMAALPDMPDGWRPGAVRAERSRTARGADGRWTMLVDWRVRLARLA